MITFLIGITVLIVGSLFYGHYCQRVFAPDDRKTPALSKADGVDYVEMPQWKNALVHLLNIAGTGPILGPIQGILFGPIAFLLIPIGNVLGGAMHDYFAGMISLREGGEQMPALIRKTMGKGVFHVYNVFLCLVLLLVGAVFIYTPGDLIVTQLIGTEAAATNPTVWIIYAIVFAYYLVATLFPIDKIIGKVYPIFGAILLLSSVGVAVGLFIKGYPLTELSLNNWKGLYPGGQNLIPMFFVTVACGIVSGFHSTQAAMISRSMGSEKEGLTTFYTMMTLEGVISMIWAAAAMGAYNSGLVTGPTIGTPAVIGIVAKDMLGTVGGLIAILGIIILPITSGDTALRSLRLMLGDLWHIDQKPARNRFLLSSGIFIIVAFFLVYAKLNTEGFNILWRYFAWSNQVIAVFAFALITIYLKQHHKNFWISLLPGTFYCFVISSYILNAKIGFNLNFTWAYTGATLCALLYLVLLLKYRQK